MSLTTSQKRKVEALIALTGTLDNDSAKRLLIDYGWDVETAADAFMESVGYAVTTAAPAKGGSGTGAAASGLDAEFSRLEDKSDAGKMNVDQIEAFATELGIDAYSDVGILIISYHMAVETQGVITLEEFKRGMTKMGARSVAELKARLPTIRSDMQRDANFAPFYTWCYVYNCVPGQKSLQLDAVQALAPMVLSAYKPWPLLTEWTEFLGKQTKTLSKDTWTMTLDFIKNVKPDLSNYDDESAWPVLFDEFVEFINKKKKASA